MEKLSIWSTAFQDPITTALQHDKSLVVWHQKPWCGGEQAWHLIQSIEALWPILENGQVASAFTVYEWQEQPLKDATHLGLDHQVCAYLKQEISNQMVLLYAEALNNMRVPVELTYLDDASDVQEWFIQHPITRIRLGKIPSIWNGELVRGYYPDTQGIPRAGAY
jgi:hypothetical protein